MQNDISSDCKGRERNEEQPRELFFLISFCVGIQIVPMVDQTVSQALTVRERTQNDRVIDTQFEVQVKRSKSSLFFSLLVLN